MVVTRNSIITHILHFLQIFIYILTQVERYLQNHFPNVTLLFSSDTIKQARSIQLKNTIMHSLRFAQLVSLFSNSSMETKNNV